MKKILAATLITIALFLFIGVLGSNITGYAVTKGEINLENYPYPFIKNGVYNTLYIVTPDNPTTTELNSAKIIARELQNNRVKPPTIITESEIPNTPANLILIGTTVNSEKIRNDITLLPEINDALIEIQTDYLTTELIVTGRNDNALQKAVEVLTNNYQIEGQKVKISGTHHYSLTFYY